MMSSRRRLPVTLVACCSLVGLVLILFACRGEDPELVTSLQQQWTTTTADGEPEHLSFGDTEMELWAEGAKRRASCHYRILSFSEKARTIDITTFCKKLTGTNNRVNYRLKVSEGLDSFVLILEKRAIAEYRAAQ